MIESEEHKENLIKIAKKLEFKSQSYPKDENGEPTAAYLEYLSLMYNSEIINLVLELDAFPKGTSLLKFSRKVNMDKKELMKKLEPLAKRGFVIKMGNYYSIPMPLFIYDMPFILKENYDHEDSVKFAKLSRTFFEEGYYNTWETSRKGTPRMRILTVSEEVEDMKEIVPIEEVYKIIDKKSDFAVVPCPCRKRKEVEGIRECKDKYPIHNCIMMGPYAKAILNIHDPIVKEITKEEVIRLTKEAAEIGLVHCTDNVADNCNILCACCECCCGMLAGLTRLDNPKAIARANFIASIDVDACTGCETCLGRCKFGAITIETIAKINPDKCLGCGLCAVTCPSEAITMKRLEREPIPGA